MFDETTVVTVFEKKVVKSIFSQAISTRSSQSRMFAVVIEHIAP